MPDRKAILERLLNLSAPVGETAPALAGCDWDADEPVSVLQASQGVSALRRFLTGRVTGAEIEEWANAIEGRDDIGYEADRAELLNGLIFELANPYLTRPLTPESAEDWVRRLQASPPPT